MKRVLVTGATGFIGRHAVRSLQDKGFEIHAITRESGAELGEGVVLQTTDLFDRRAVRDVIYSVGASHLLHLAWDTEPGKFWRTPVNLDWVSASLHLVRNFAEAGGKRVVCAGTCAEYDWGHARLIENVSPCCPRTLYAASKDGLRRILASYASERALSFAWGRVFFIYGPGEKPGRLVKDASQALIAGRRFEAKNKDLRRDFLHVADVGEAFAALLASQVSGPVNIASGYAVPISSLVLGLARELGREELIDFGPITGLSSEPELVEADVSRLRQDVGFSPRFRLADGLASVMADELARHCATNRSEPSVSS